MFANERTAIPEGERVALDVHIPGVFGGAPGHIARSLATLEAAAGSTAGVPLVGVRKRD